MLCQGRTWDGSSAADRALRGALATALARIHACGIVQNDVKPDNIMLERATGRLRFIDFALAKHTACEEELDTEDSELNAMVAQADPAWLVRLLLSSGSRQRAVHHQA